MPWVVNILSIMINYWFSQLAYGLSSGKTSATPRSDSTWPVTSHKWRAPPIRWVRGELSHVRPINGKSRWKNYVGRKRTKNSFFQQSHVPPIIYDYNYYKWSNMTSDFRWFSEWNCHGNANNITTIIHQSALRMKLICFNIDEWHAFVDYMVMPVSFSSWIGSLLYFL